MLYALLLFSLFGLLLQFYLNRQLAMAQTNQASQQSLTAYALAIWTKDKVEEELRLKEQDRKEQVSSETKKQAQTGEVDAEKDFTEQVVSEGKTAGIEREKGETGLAAGKELLLSKPLKNAKQDKQQGELLFDKGVAAYLLEGEQLTIEVKLTTGLAFQYTFSINSQMR
ncbi:competence type IV pilus minor pilin ComGG [Streptococcus ovuberis]|uniref:Late competence protein ComGG n=1 Tax=Streptococcus ovuberis TaxID=1936207 RepID=A0A7X6N0D8_9STRE|nr:competence type IV pilus minor pilin ComGG [Streptococcus ovuberis]NKZ21059.1 hypothetical protein [Streptococcus ovuberis]